MLEEMLASKSRSNNLSHIHRPRILFHSDLEMCVFDFNSWFLKPLDGMN